MDIQQIKYFSRVYEMRNYARAAEALFISRQALRKSIARLAQELGDPLFVNEGNALVPTDLADLMFDSSRSVLSAFAQMETKLSLGKLENREVVRFGQSVEASDVMTPGEMRRIVDFSSTNDFVMKGMRFVEANCADLRRRVLQGELDYASLIATSVNESLFDYDIAIEGPLYIAVRSDDPLARRESVCLADLEGRAFVSQGTGFDIHDCLQKAAEEIGMKINVISTRSGLHNRMDMVQAGVALTYAYRNLKFPRYAPDVVCLRLMKPAITWRYCTIAKKGLGDPYLLRFFSGKGEFVLWDTVQ